MPDSNCCNCMLSGPGVLPNMGNTGRITNSIGGLVGGANASRGASSTGVGNIPGLASRLNLTGNYISFLVFWMVQQSCWMQSLVAVACNYSR